MKKDNVSKKSEVNTLVHKFHHNFPPVLNAVIVIVGVVIAVAVIKFAFNGSSVGKAYQSNAQAGCDALKANCNSMYPCLMRNNLGGCENEDPRNAECMAIAERTCYPQIDQGHECGPENECPVTNYDRRRCTIVSCMEGRCQRFPGCSGGGYRCTEMFDGTIGCCGPGNFAEGGCPCSTDRDCPGSESSCHAGRCNPQTRRCEQVSRCQDGERCVLSFTQPGETPSGPTYECCGLHDECSCSTPSDCPTTPEQTRECLRSTCDTGRSRCTVVDACTTGQRCVDSSCVSETQPPIIPVEPPRPPTSPCTSPSECMHLDDRPNCMYGTCENSVCIRANYCNNGICSNGMCQNTVLQ